MAEGFNRVLLLGNLGADPELKVTQGGTSVLKLRLATTERYMDKSGVRQERTEWHSVVVWGRRAEALHKFLAKGSSIFVEGSLRTSSYEDRDGNKRYKTEVVAQNIVLSGRAPSRGPSVDDDHGGPPPDRSRRPAQPRQAPDDAGPPSGPPDPIDDYPNDDDIPF